jgi:transcriptional antiterminator RfaH
VESWYAVATKPRSEAVAEANLLRQGYHCLLPRVRRVLRTAQSARSRIEALFPNYLFIRVDVDRESLAPVRSTRGAIGVVRSGGEPVRVPDDVMARIQSRIDASDGLVRLAPPSLAAGQKVRMTEGPLADWEGVFLSEEGADRVRLLLQILGSVREVVLPRSVLGISV